MMSEWQIQASESGDCGMHMRFEVFVCYIWCTASLVIGKARVITLTRRAFLDSSTRPVKAHSWHHIDIGHQIVDGLFIFQNGRHQCHLRSIFILGVCASKTLLKIFQLSCHIPVAHTLKFGGLHEPHALSVLAMAG